MDIYKEIEYWHPKLKNNKWKIINTNKNLDDFNCFSFAIDVYNEWSRANCKLWHNPNDRYATVKNYIEFYSTYNYKICENDSYELDYEKIAIYSNNNFVTHACKQFGDMWRSKLGSNVIIEHKLEWLSGTDSENYGEIAAIMKRKLI
jgi:hypothetical protein